MGADIASHVFYSRIKGEMEAQLAALGFARLVLARPSLLAGGRARLGQPRRWGEQLALMLFEPLGGLMPARVRPIDAAVVARAMRMAVRRDGPAVQIIESAELHTLGGTP